MSTTIEKRPTVPARFQELHDRISSSMERLHVPGVAVGITVDGEEHTAGFGVTNADYPAEVRADTLFQIGSTTKTVTATTVMRLVEQGTLDLDSPVRQYLPDLRLRERGVAEGVSMRHLLTHTAGWTGDFFADMGRGEDALARIVQAMAELEQITPLGEVWSYNNAAFYLAGRVIEAVTGQPYETAARELVVDPLGMSSSFFFPEEVMLRSFAVGHNVVDGTPVVATPWPIPRAANPAGGLVSTAGDQLRYARFHMGDGTAEDGARILSAASIKEMQTPVVSAGEGQQIGLSWFLRDVEGVRIVQHGGGTNGQISLFEFAPERKFALTILTNAGPGGELNDEVERWVLKHYLGISEPEPVHQQRTAGELEEYVGTYEAAITGITLELDGGSLILKYELIGEFPADEPPPLPPPTPVAFYAAEHIIALEGPLKDARGEFLRDTEGQLAWLRIGGRLHRRRT